MFELYKEVASDLFSVLSKFIHDESWNLNNCDRFTNKRNTPDYINNLEKQKSEFNIGSILNKITYIDKKKFENFDFEKNITTFDAKKYRESIFKQEKLIKELKTRIDLDIETNLKKFFSHDQIILFRLTTKGKDTKVFDRTMKIEYLFETFILQEKRYKKYISNIFKSMIQDYGNMKNSLICIEENKFKNQTDLDVNNEEEIFEKRIKIFNKVKQDFIMVFLFYQNKIITGKDLNRFLKTYIDKFDKINSILASNALEREGIKLWASGVRHLEVLIDNFKYKSFDIDLCLKYKTTINALCPSLRFM